MLFGLYWSSYVLAKIMGQGLCIHVHCNDQKREMHGTLSAKGSVSSCTSHSGQKALILLGCKYVF